ncbi:phenylalanine--tRNA ligase beta subunit-related protein [Microbacterium oryzae]|uniref:B3/B4 domain-containing protein n=1 Tax=Microbacterium oryzae TaxID=743009 RepID=UPI0025B049AA|nr:phenylalanine--tRNA ligase beta subunit-related protein [Microbacterium oryzae]MDN3311705.1 phenylalanine--tRNA ligase beta subunit-related protein [Microbacterium oryzae]
MDERRTVIGNDHLLRQAHVDADVFALRADYRALLIVAEGIEPGPSDTESEQLLTEAEALAREALKRGPVEELPHVAAWRDAYRAFGAKPQRTRNSLEALTRRAETGLPRVNRLTDIYNAISVLHQIPLGGEDADRYVGAPQLLRASGDERFDTVAGGELTEEHPDAGEVVWADDAGVTCRRWNWRQGRRTQLTRETTSALFILDVLAPVDDDALARASEQLLAHLTRLGPSVRTAQRLIAAD